MNRQDAKNAKGRKTERRDCGEDEGSLSSPCHLCFSTFPNLPWRSWRLGGFASPSKPDPAPEVFAPRPLPALHVCPQSTPHATLIARIAQSIIGC